jgi:soluble P-type ATPase
MKRIIITSLLAPLAIGLAACDVDQTKEAELPEVKVTGGQVPEFDVETADVDIGTKKTTVEVPDVDVKMPGDAEGEPVTSNE